MGETPSASFERVDCDFCGSTVDETVFSGPDRLLGHPGVFTVVRCTECGLLRQNPRPTLSSIKTFYSQEYDPYSIAIEDEPSPLRRFDRRYGMRKRRKAIEQYIPRGRLLDVGCATGNFIHEMRRTGRWEVEGLEPNPTAATYAKERLGLKVHQARLTEVELPPASFDVVTMWNVLEHLHHPVANLHAVRKLLKPGGLFVFSIPNLESVGARLFGRFWMGWELPRHIYFFPRPVAVRMLQEAGLSVVRWRCLSGSYLSFLMSLRFRLEDKGRKSLVRALMTVAGSPPARLAAAPLFWLLTSLGHASLITGFARCEAT